jgi:acyl-[acyl-carrier-protein]-phospholipid O-acyltransferase/long-chain-fatty-acid--[acyl-carrier-protein] ligase
LRPPNKLWPGSNHATVSIPDARKGEAIVLMTELVSAELGILPEHFRKEGLTELAVPRKIVKVRQLPLLGTGKIDYVQTKILVLEHLNENKTEGESDDQEKID